MRPRLGWQIRQRSLRGRCRGCLRRAHLGIHLRELSDAEGVLRAVGDVGIGEEGGEGDDGKERARPEGNACEAGKAYALPLPPSTEG
jgi:hypothetical protein